MSDRIGDEQTTELTEEEMEFFPSDTPEVEEEIRQVAIKNGFSEEVAARFARAAIGKKVSD